MPAEDDAITYRISVADVLRIHLRPAGICRLQHLDMLIEYKLLDATRAERQRIRAIMRAGSWPPDDNRVLELTATERFAQDPFERAVQGFLEHPVYSYYPQSRQRRGEPRDPGEPASECSFEGCAHPAHAKGLCKGHYTQQRRGQPLKPLQSLPLHHPQVSR